VTAPAPTRLTLYQSAFFPSADNDSASITLSANDVITVNVQAWQFTGSDCITSISGQGSLSGLSFTAITNAKYDAASFDYPVRSWVCIVGTGGTGTIRVVVDTGTCADVQFEVIRWANADTSGTIVASATATGADNATAGPITIADRTASTNNVRHSVFNTAASFSAATPGSGYTELTETNGNGSGFYSQYGDTDTDPSFTSSANNGNTGWTGVVYEVKEGSTAVTSTGAATAPAPIAAATGLVGMTGTGAATAPAPIAAATGVEAITSTAAAEVPAPVAAATATVAGSEITSTAAAVAPELVALASGLETIASTGAGLFTAPIALASGVETITSSSAAQLPTLTALATVVETITSTGAATLNATAAATGVVNLPANTQLVIGDPTSFIGYAMVGPSTASSDISSTAAATVGAPTAAATAVETLSSSAAAQVPAPTAAATSALTITSTAAAQVPVPVGDAIGTIGSGDLTGTATATVGPPVAAATGTVVAPVTSTAAAQFPDLAALATAALTLTSTGVAVVPFPVASATVVDLDIAVRIGSISVTSALSLGSVSASIPGGISIGKVESD